MGLRHAMGVLHLSLDPLELRLVGCEFGPAGNYLQEGFGQEILQSLAFQQVGNEKTPPRASSLPSCSQSGRASHSLAVVEQRCGAL